MKKVKISYAEATSIRHSLQSAIGNRRKSITLKGIKISLPEPQTSGTLGQQSAYRGQASDNLIEKHFQIV